MMSALVAAGGDAKFRSEDGTNVLLAAAQSNPDALALALKLAPDVNITNKNGKTPLHVLMSYSSSSDLTNEQMTSMFTQLAKHGARIDLADKNGKTAINIAEDEQFRARVEFAKIFHTSGVKL
jgi:ankyrin repeat protein